MIQVSREVAAQQLRAAACKRSASYLVLGAEGLIISAPTLGRTGEG